MDELIAKLEAATEGSRELDAAICRVIEPDSPIGKHCTDDPEPTWYSNDGKQDIPWFTTIIDTAMTLVPKNFPAMVQRNVDPSQPKGFALVGEFSKLPGRTTMQRGNGASPALALCIAALRARHASPASDGEVR